MLKVFSFFTVLIVISLTGCNGGSELTSGSKILALTEEVQSNLEEVSKIEVLYSDGHEISVEDPTEIEKITNVLRSIKLETKDDSGVGYLYKLKIIDKDKTIELNNTMEINNKFFDPVGDEITELNQIIIKKGREKYPKLLSGIDI